jgi:SNF2 family DNA or RNA helicase
MVNINLITGTKTKFYDPEMVLIFDYSRANVELAKQIPGARYSKRAKSWHFPTSSAAALFAAFPAAIVNRNVKTEFKDYDFNTIDFPEQVTMGWGTDAYKIPTVYHLGSAAEEIKIRATPYAYQKAGIKFLVKGGNVILADDMGLGKTLQAIGASVLLKAKKVLVICPNSAKYNWAAEIAKFAPTANYIVVDGNRQERARILQSKSRFMFYIINYDALPTLSEVAQSLKPDIIILDEAHRIKNRKTKRSRAVKKIPSRYKFLLTGTPLMNRVEELWSLLKFIEPTRWPSYTTFVNTYCAKGGYQNREIVGYKNLGELQEKLGRIMLRRRKDEVLKDLPDKVFQDYYVDLDAKTMAIYRQAEQQTIAYITENKSIAINGIFAKLTRLKQIAVAPEILGAEHKSTKIIECEKIVDEILESGQKVIIYSQFRRVTDYLERLFRARGIKLVHVNGRVDAQQRKVLVDEFQNNPECQVFIGTTQSCKEAITLTAASYVIFMDKLWNPADNNQAMDRCHRIGQKNTVNVISLIAKHTIEETIEKRLEDKQDLFNAVIESDDGVVLKKNVTGDLLGELSEILKRNGS